MITADRWTCPVCDVTEELEGPVDVLDAGRRLVQQGHAERHRAERSKVGTVAAALLEVAEELASFRVRLVVSPADLERVRGLVVRRQLPVDVYADDELADGQGYIIRPRRGVRELAQQPAGDVGKDAPA